MGTAGALLGLLLTTLAGAGVLFRLLPRDAASGTGMLTLGGGYLLGVGLVGGAMALGSRLPPATTLATVGAVLTVGVGLLALSLRRRWSHPGAPWALAPLERGLLALLVLLAAANAVGMIGEVVERPLLGWDAWKVWAVKPLVWHQLSPLVDFVDLERWLASSDPLVHTVPGHHYPELIGRYQLFLAELAGRWDDALPFLPWPLLWLAGLASFLGLARLHGLPWQPTLLGTVLLAATPFPAVHGVLPGYMDLWIAVELLLALGFLSHWLRCGARASALLGAAFLLLLAATKVEGAIWGAIAVLAVLLARRPPRQVGTALAVAAAVVLVWALGGGLSWEVAGRELTLRPDLIVLPFFGSAELAFENRLGAFVRGLYELPNWQVLAALVPLLALLLLPTRRPDPMRLATGLFLLFSLLFLFLLFNLTPAGYWAEDLTASNRLTLHVLPSAFWLLLICYGDLEEGSSRAAS